MTAYVLRRLLLMIPVLTGISVLVFLMLRLLPGDIIDTLVGNDLALPPETRLYLRKQLGLEDPIYLQYWNWVSGVVQGDFGRSMRNNQPVRALLLDRLPLTIELALLATSLSLLLALPLGILSAIRHNSFTDVFVRVFGLVGISVPNFWLATMLLLVASVYFNWMPPLMFVTFAKSPIENLKIMAFPAFSLAVSMMAISMRMTRSCMLEVLRQDYIRTARAKGLREGSVLVKHALKNAFIPVITVVGIQFGYLLGGTIIIEQIFSIPGVGWMLLQGIYQRDYPVVQGAVLWLALMFVLINLVVDLIYGYLDPRIRYA